MATLHIGDRSVVKNDISYSGSLSSSNQWNYTANIGFEPNYVIINRIAYYNDGTDTMVYTLKSDLFGLDPRQIGAVFTESNANNYYGSVHQVNGSTNGNSFTFSALGVDGTTAPSGTITVDMTFVRNM